MFYGNLTGFTGAVSAPAFAPLGVYFDGTNDYMGRSTTGDTDTKVWSASVFCTTNSTDASEVLGGGNCGVNHSWLIKESDNGWFSSLKASDGHVKSSCSNTTLFSGATDTWIHFALCSDVANGTSKTHFFVNGTDEVTSPAAVDANMDHTCSNYYIGAGMGAGSRYTGAMAEIMVWTDEYIDWSIAANLAKVYDGGNPVDPGSDGSTVTGTAPNTYCSVRPGEAATAFATNRGSGGDFSITGALVLHSSNPTD